MTPEEQAKILISGYLSDRSLNSLKDGIVRCLTALEQQRDAALGVVEEGRKVIESLMNGFSAYYPAGSTSLEQNPRWKEAQAFLSRPLPTALQAAVERNQKREEKRDDG